MIIQNRIIRAILPKSLGALGRYLLQDLLDISGWIVNGIKVRAKFVIRDNAPIGAIKGVLP